MTDINILSLFGISVEQLEKYEQVDSSQNSVTFLIRKAIFVTTIDLMCTIGTVPYAESSNILIYIPIINTGI